VYTANDNYIGLSPTPIHYHVMHIPWPRSALYASRTWTFATSWLSHRSTVGRTHCRFAPTIHIRYRLSVASGSRCLSFSCMMRQALRLSVRILRWCPTHVVRLGSVACGVRCIGSG